jgi:hypothetical protein
MTRQLFGVEERVGASYASKRFRLEQWQFFHNLLDRLRFGC